VVNAIKVGSFAGTLVDFLIIATVVGCSRNCSSARSRLRGPAR